MVVKFQLYAPLFFSKPTECNCSIFTGFYAYTKLNHIVGFLSICGYAVGDLVLIKHAPSSVLKAPSRKLKRDWVGPFKIQSIIDDSHYMISDWTGQLSHKRFHVNRLKPFSLSLGKVKDGKLQTVHNTRELFRIWKNIKGDAELATTAMQTHARKCN